MKDKYIPRTNNLYTKDLSDEPQKNTQRCRFALSPPYPHHKCGVNETFNTFSIAVRFISDEILARLYGSTQQLGLFTNSIQQFCADMRAVNNITNPPQREC